MKLVTAKWCGPCKVLKAQMESEGLTVEMVDADSNLEYCQQMGIKAVPTLVVGNELVTTDILQAIKKGTK